MFIKHKYINTSTIDYKRKSACLREVKTIKYLLNELKNSL